MKLLKKGVLLPVTIVTVASLLFACGAPATENNVSTAKKIDTNEAFTVTFFNATGSSEDYFRQNTEPYMKKIFPNVTTKYIQSGKGTTIENLVTAGTIPDIMLISSSQVIDYNDLGLLSDLTPLAKANNVDLGRFDDNMMNTIKKMAPNNELYVLPWSHLPNTLYYNKNVFDKFGVAYPKDGMSWDEVADLTRKLSRTEDGITYRGFDMNRASYIRINQLSLAWIDPKTEKASVNTDAWKDMLSTFGNLYKIPGNAIPNGAPHPHDAFFRGNQTLAMVVTSGLFPTPDNAEMLKAWESIDIVTLPTFKSAPGIGTQYAGAALAVSSTSKYKDQAMLMIASATSDEAQKNGASIVRFPTVKNKDVLSSFGQGTEMLATKNMKALYQLKVAPTTFSSKYDQATLSIMTKTFDDIAKGTVDVVTALREAEEKINLKIAEIKAEAK